MGLFSLVSTKGWAQAETDSVGGLNDTILLPQGMVVANSFLGAEHLNGFTGTKLDSVTLNAYQGQSVADVLSETTPVFVKSYGIGSLATVSFRGTGASHTQLFWNGIPANTPTLGHTDLALVPIAFADQLYLGHGGASLGLGSGGLGGAVNLKGNTRFDDGFRGQVFLRTASFGDHRVSTQLRYGKGKLQAVTRWYAIQAENNFEYRNTSRINEPVEEMEHAGLEQSGLQQELYWRPSSTNRVAVRYMYAGSDRQLPGLLTSTAISQQDQQDQVHRAMAEWENTAMTDWRWLARTGYTHDQLQYQDRSAQIFSRFATDGFHPTLQAQYTGLQNWTLKAKANLDYFQASSTGIGSRQQQVRPGGQIQGEWQAHHRLSLNTLVRQEWNNEERLPLQPAVGINYRLRPAWQIRGNATRTLRIPSLNDLYWNPGGNPNLRTEVGWHYELASNWLWRPSKGPTELDFEVAGCYGVIRDWILWSPLESGFWSPQNLRTVDHYGIETKLNWNLDWGVYQFVWSGNYAYTRAVNREPAFPGDAAEGKQLLYVPVHQFNQRFGLQRKAYQMNVHWQFTGERFTNNANTDGLPAFQLLHLSAHRNWKSKIGHWQLRGEVRNVLNVNYQAILNRPMPGRQYAISLRYQFGKS